jgi:hypothetical protein
MDCVNTTRAARKRKPMTVQAPSDQKPQRPRIPGVACLTLREMFMVAVSRDRTPAFEANPRCTHENDDVLIPRISRE